MGNGVQSLEEKISKFEGLILEMKEVTREAHSALKALEKERKTSERYLATEGKRLVDERVNEVVKTTLDEIGPKIREQTNLIYARVGEQIDKLINLSMGKEFATHHGRVDIRPQLAEKLREWIREIVDDEEANGAKRASERSYREA